MKALGFSPSVHPPISNTGGDCPSPSIECGVDYLRGTVPIKYSADIRQLLEDFFDVLLQLQVDRDGRPLSSGFYKLRHSSGHGVDVLSLNRAYDDSSPDNHCLVNISGSALARISVTELYSFFRALLCLEFSATRLDLKIDDFTKTVTPLLAFDAAENGNTKGFRVYRYIVDHQGSRTFYAGRRGSDGGGKFLRIYDKFIESGGSVDSVRVEVELSSIKALEAFESLSICHFSQWPNFIAAVVRESADFLDRDNGSRRACRSERFSWWSFIVDSPDSFEFTPVVRKPVIERTERWLKNQCAASMVAVCAANSGAGDAVSEDISQFILSFNIDKFASQIYDWILEGINNLSERHLQMIREHIFNKSNSVPFLV